MDNHINCWLLSICRPHAFFTTSAYQLIDFVLHGHEGSFRALTPSSGTNLLASIVLVTWGILDADQSCEEARTVIFIKFSEMN